MYSGVPIVMPTCVRFERLARLGHAGQAEIGDFHLARAGQHDVLGLDVAMDDVLLGSLAQCRGHLPHDRDGLGGVEPATATAEELLQVLPGTYSWAI